MNALTPISLQYSQTACKVYLHGQLGSLFGDVVAVPASTVSSAIRNVLLLHPGLINVLEHGEYRVVRGSLDSGFDLDEGMLHMQLGRDREIHIFPMARGAGGSHGGTLKTVLGAVLIVAAVALVVFQPELAPVLGSTLTSALVGSAGAIALFGASLLLGGLSRLIAPQPSLGASYLINGNLNTAQQGVPVPLVYGRARVGSVVIASSYAAEDYTTTTSNYEGSAAYYDANGGYSGTLKAFDTGNPLPPGASGKGGGGKSGGGGGGGIEAPNTLESKAIVRLIDLISEGPITGLVNGPQSIFFNNTPLMNPDGTWNFRGVYFKYLFGTSDQPPISGYPSGSETVSVGDQVFYGTPVIQQLQSTTATQTRVTIELPGLYATNTQNGDINPSTIGVIVEIAEVTGTSVGPYTQVVYDEIHGKCTSAYQKSYVFDLPGSGPSGTISAWNVRVTKTTPESAVSTTINQLYWTTYDLIENYQISYANSACVALEIDSEAFGSNLPARSYLVDGIQVQVPANYNATTRTYATTGIGTLGGTWDFSTFTPETTSNPAWILYDFMSNSRYGLGLSSQNLETAAIQLYTISQYCDGLVPDGNGATEPRYQLNGAFTQRVDAFKLLQAIAATFRGQIYWAGGQVSVSADMPKSPIKIYSAANVINGNFVYEGTSLKTRHTVANIHFTDPDNQYRPGVEITELPPQVAQRGVFAADVLGFGVTSRGLAHRLGNWLLYTENFQTETVTFSVGWDSAFVMPGDLIQIADVNVAGIRMGGRLRSNSSTTALALDMAFSPVAGQSYTATVVLEDGTIAQSVTISSFYDVPFGTGSYTVANLATPLPKPVYSGSVFILQDANTPPTEWLVVGITESSRGIFEIVAAEYNPNKYALVEQVPTLNVPAFSALPASLIAPLAPPTNVAGMTTLSGQGLTTLIKTFASWTMPVDSRIVQYQVSVVNSSGTTVAALAVTGASTEIDGLSPDTYYISVRSLGANGSTSSWAYSSPLTITGQSNVAPSAPTGLSATSGNRTVYLQWTAAAGQAVQFYNVFRSSTATAPGQSGSLAALIGTSGGTSYNDADSQTLTPGTTWYYWVEAVTTTGVIGALSASVTALISYILGSDIGSGAIATINQFSSALQPIGVWTGASLPTNPAAVGGANSIVWSSDYQLYNWNSSTSQWQTGTNSLSASKITAGTLNAGVIIGSLANFGTVQITNAQIANLTVTTSLIAPNAISQYTFSSFSGPTSGANSFTITVANPTGSVILFSLLVSGYANAGSGSTASTGYSGGEGGGSYTTYTTTVSLPITTNSIYLGANIIAPDGEVTAGTFGTIPSGQYLPALSISQDAIITPVIPGQKVWVINNIYTSLQSGSIGYPLTGDYGLNPITQYTFSCYFYLPVGFTGGAITMSVQGHGGTIVTTTIPTTTHGAWFRVSSTFTTGTSCNLLSSCSFNFSFTNLQHGVNYGTTPNSVQNCYFSGAQVELGATPSTFVSSVRVMSNFMAVSSAGTIGSTNIGSFNATNQAFDQSGQTGTLTYRVPTTVQGTDGTNNNLVNFSLVGLLLKK